MMAVASVVEYLLCGVEMHANDAVRLSSYLISVICCKFHASLKRSTFFCRNKLSSLYCLYSAIHFRFYVSSLLCFGFAQFGPLRCGVVWGQWAGRPGPCGQVGFFLFLLFVFVSERIETVNCLIIFATVIVQMLTARVQQAGATNHNRSTDIPTKEATVARADEEKHEGRRTEGSFSTLY